MSRFDFTHSGRLSEVELEEVERLVNERIWADHEVTKAFASYRDAIDHGAMALFGEKYGDTVRTVEVPGFSLELCGGCHVKTTGEIGLFKIISETGTAAGVRRIEAVTGAVAYELVKEQERLLNRLGRMLKVPTDNLERRAENLLAEQRELRDKLQNALQGSAVDQVAQLVAGADEVSGAKIAVGAIETAGSDALRAFGDRLREHLGTGVGVVMAKIGDRQSLLAVVTDDLISKGVRADAVIREVAKLAGGKGGGRPHMAQASTGEPEQAERALAKVAEIVRPMLEQAGL